MVIWSGVANSTLTVDQQESQTLPSLAKPAIRLVRQERLIVGRHFFSPPYSCLSGQPNIRIGELLPQRAQLHCLA